jgi:hypothetical protein
MDNQLLARSGLSEAGVTAEVALEGAAASAHLVLPYCVYLLSAMSSALSVSVPDYSSRTGELTVYSSTWHASSLGRLSDADIANLWRLADYLMLDAACFRCVEDVAVQRKARSGVSNLFLNADTSTRIGARADRLPEIWLDMGDNYVAVARGLQTPTGSPLDLFFAAMWGHHELIMRVRAAECSWDNVDHCFIAGAAYGNNVQLLQKLRETGCRWADTTLFFALRTCTGEAAVWALANGAPTYVSWLSDAARFGCLPALQWAWANERLPVDLIPQLRDKVDSTRNRRLYDSHWPGVEASLNQTAAWLDEIAAAT